MKFPILDRSHFLRKKSSLLAILGILLAIGYFFSSNSGGNLPSVAITEKDTLSVGTGTLQSVIQ